MFEILVFASTMPRIQAISLPHASRVVKQWFHTAQANDDMQRTNSLSSSLRMYNVPPSATLGCVAVHTNKICAVCLIEKAEDNEITLWNVESDDYSSGSLLVRALVMNANITLGNHLDDRWKIAKRYFDSD
jgi:hypothetical protein